MIEIRLFGWIRNEVGTARLTVAEGTVLEVLEDIATRYPQIDKKELMQSIIFINNNAVAGKKRLSKPLKEGDEMAILSPVGGG